MAQPGFTSLLINNPDLLPHLTLDAVLDAFQELEGYVETRTVMDNVMNIVDGEGRISQCIISFHTHAQAASAIALHPVLTIAAHTYAVNASRPNNMDNARTNSTAQQPYPVASRPEGQRPRKRLRKEPPKPPKPQCKVCFTELDDAYSTPCRRCQSPRCYDCLKKEFEFALIDVERMPVTCCSIVVHHEVVDKILPTAEIEAYKLRFDETNTANPLYCPVPTCSTFLPPRLVAKDSTKVECITCQATVCTICKEQAHENHVCANNGLRAAIVDKFHYKVCPKCGIAVAKMFGCPHVRCQCGAHFCWDCLRPINACYRKPCRVAREDGQQSEFELTDSDSENEPDASAPEQVMQVDQPMTIPEADTVPVEEPVPVTENVVVAEPAVETNTNEAIESPPTVEETAAQQQVAREETMGEEATANIEAEIIENKEETEENLDDPETHDWEGGSVDFGDEPSDEAWDIWGCRHQFREFEKQHIPELWKVGVDPNQPGDLEVGCLSCFKGAEVWETKQEKETTEETKGDKTDSEPTPSSEPTSSSEPVVPVKKVSRSKRAFECTCCGVVYCGTCKRAAMEKVRKETTVMDEE